MTAKEQLRILSVVLPKLQQERDEHPSRRHFVAKVRNSVSIPTLREDKV